MSTKCIFCKIIAGDAPADICYQDDELLVFKDIKPCAKYHYLAVPKKHIPNVNSLSKEDSELIERLVQYGKSVVAEKGAELGDLRLGFHLPPFNTVGHLHLHVIAPASELSLLHRTMFRPNSYWFSTVDQILENLQNKL